MAKASPTPARYWLVKSEPDSYGWSQLVAEKKAAWTGVRNYTARINLRAMQKGDPVFYYHSNVGKEIVGLAEVTKTAYSDPTADEGDWSCVDLKPVKPLKKAVTLEQMKTDPILKDILVVRNSRLSVMPITAAEAARILKLSA